jgi:hypothetical protein
MARARFLYGHAAGQEIEVNGPRHRLPIVAPLPTWEELSAAVDDELPIEERYEEYEVHPMRFQSGHRHLYAAPAGVNFVGLMNEMWFGYKEFHQRLRTEAELREEVRALRHELWRYKYKDTFGCFPEKAQ